MTVQILKALYYVIRENYGCITVSVLVGYLTGSIVTRRIMAPSFCPDCIERKKWQDDLANDIKTKSPEEKAESRRFYYLRRKKKPEE